MYTLSILMQPWLKNKPAASSDENNCEMVYVATSGNATQSGIRHDSSSEEFNAKCKTILLLTPPLVRGQAHRCEKRGTRRSAQDLLVPSIPSWSPCFPSIPRGTGDQRRVLVYYTASKFYNLQNVCCKSV